MRREMKHANKSKGEKFMRAFSSEFSSNVRHVDEFQKILTVLMTGKINKDEILSQP
jgi:ribosomal protein S17E